MSHSSADTVFVEGLVDDLSNANLHVRFAKHVLKSRDSVVGTTSSALTDTDYLIVALFMVSVESRWVQAELSAGDSDEGAGHG